MQLLAGAEKLEYHEDGEPCKYFTAEDMQKIIEKAMSWGMEIPEEFQNEVLKDYMKKMVL